MKILYINALYPPYIAGGAEISLKLIVEGMKAKGYEVAVLSLVPDKGLHSDYVAGVKVYRAGLNNGYWPFAPARPGRFRRLLWHIRDSYNASMQAYVAEVLRLEQPTVVSCHNLVGWSIAVWDEIRRSGIPMIQVLHDMYLLSPNSTLFKKGRKEPYQDLLSQLLRRRHQRASKELAAVVGISQSILDRFRQYHYFTHVPQYVIHNARYIPDNNFRREREPGSTLAVGYIGTLSMVKGLEWLITQFKASQVAGRLVIAGNGQDDEVAFFRRLASTDKRITFIGYAEPGDFYSNIDVLVVPSLWEEPLGMVAIEGLAHNLPVIASNRGGLCESVADGTNGILCDPDNPHSLGKALKRLWQDVPFYNRVAAQARVSVSKYLNVDRMVSEYENVLHAAIKSHEID